MSIVSSYVNKFYNTKTVKAYGSIADTVGSAFTTVNTVFRGTAEIAEKGSEYLVDSADAYISKKKENLGRETQYDIIANQLEWGEKVKSQQVNGAIAIRNAFILQATVTKEEFDAYLKSINIDLENEVYRNYYDCVFNIMSSLVYNKKTKKFELPDLDKLHQAKAKSVESSTKSTTSKDEVNTLDAYSKALG